MKARQSAGFPRSTSGFALTTRLAGSSARPANSGLHRPSPALGCGKSVLGHGIRLGPNLRTPSRVRALFRRTLRNGVIRRQRGLDVTHDPRRLVEGIRDQLSRHDKPIAFLFGAGTSCAAKSLTTGEALIPAVVELTARCEAAVKAMGALQGAAWGELTAEAQAEDGNALIEAILSRVQVKVAALAGPSEKLTGLNRDGWLAVEACIRRTVAEAVQPAENEIPHELPHHAFARWISRAARQRAIEIFTTNYDLLLERALEESRVAAFDGFVGSYRPFFLQESLVHADAAPGSSWTRLWKIHGSVNWQWQVIGGHERIIRGEPSPSGELIAPSYRKYDESRKQPYVAMLDRLSRFLAQDDALLLTCGYSFGDQHINEVVYDALARPSRTHVVSLQYADPANGSDLAAAGARWSRLMVLGPTQAWVGNVSAGWALQEPVTLSTATFLDLAFDSDAEPDPKKVSLTGQFKLGDFGRFARFLEAMTDPDGAMK